MSCFSAFSTRGTATSAATAAGISTSEIMIGAGWSNRTTFDRFHHRPPQKVTKAASFGTAVLQSGVYKHAM